MPQILVVTDSQAMDSAVVYRERISSADLESAHFSGQLVERVTWAVEDADRFERDAGRADDRSRRHGDGGESRPQSVDVSFEDQDKRGVLRQVGCGDRA